jgi:hypothetical protein
LWDNTFIDLGYSGIISSYWSVNDNWIISADDFDADAPWIIEKVFAKGFSGASSKKPTKFSISIYENGENKPGKEIYKNREIPVENVEVEVWITLPEPFELPCAGKYWISIAGSYDASVSDESEMNGHRWYIFCHSKFVENNFHLQDKFGILNPPLIWIDQGNSGYPSTHFLITGDPNNTSTKYNIYRDGAIIVSNVTETSYTDENFDATKGHTWDVAVVCEDGESEPDGVVKDACQEIGINEYSTHSIYPNPVSDIVYFEDESIVNVKVFNSVGQFINSYNNTHKINVSSYKSGIYFFRVTNSENGVKLFKVVIL